METTVYLSINDHPKKVASKLHKQFGHPTPEKLISLIRNANHDNVDLETEIKEVSKNCEACAKFRKPCPRPVVSVPMATKFNETVSMDLKVWGKRYFIVIVDLATRFCASAVIDDKKPRTILKALFLSWISFFGAPKKLLSDNGREFDNSEMRQFGESFNVRIMATAAESPWSNGVCERLNGVLGGMVSKIQADSGCDVQVALAWAVSARNALANFSGFSPNQLVFGQNPAMPDLFNCKPPALGSVVSSDIVRENLNALHVARKEFLQCESSEKLRRALRSNIRSTPTENVNNGDLVYYKRNEGTEWHGPGSVIGRDGKQVLVRHGGTYVRVHTCRLARAVNSEPVDSEIFDSSDLNAARPTSEQTIEDRYSSEEESEVCNNDRVSRDETTSPDQNSILDPGTDMEIMVDGPTNETRSTPAISKIRFKVGQKLQGVDCNTGEVVSGQLVSRAGKATGKYGNCFNMKHDSHGGIEWVNLNDLSDVLIIPENDERVVMFVSDDVEAAKYKEIQNWQENNVYEETSDLGQSCISVRWVVTEKLKDGKTIVKARLVARGFEEESSGLRKDSPTIAKESVRVAIGIAASKQWHVNSVDIKSAYLQGDEINRDILLKPPPECYEGRLWKLRKTVYGLCDAARAWYLRVKKELLELSVKVCSLDPSLFVWYKENILEGILCVYVDDFLWAGTAAFKTNVIDKIYDLFSIGSAESSSFKYIGLNIRSCGNCITIDQHHYVSTLTPIKISPSRSALKNSELSEREKSEYKALLGQLNWISTNTRPDISFETCNLSVSHNKATVSDLLRLNKLVSRAVSSPLKIYVPRLWSLESCSLECFSDASFANLSDGGSQGGFIIFLKDVNGNRCPLHWQSRKVRRVVKSTLSAEALALLDGAETAVYLGKMLQELTRNICKVHCMVDNKSLYDTIYSSKSVEDKRLRIDIAVLRDMLSRGEIASVSWVSTKLQLADSLTKRGACTHRLRAVVSGN